MKFQLVIVFIIIILLSSCTQAPFRQESSNSPTITPQLPTAEPTIKPTEETSEAIGETAVPTPRPNINNELAAWYPFDNNANDISGNENDGILFGATFVEDRFGKPNSAIQFDGVDDYIQVNHNNRALDLNFTATLSLWTYHQPQPEARSFYTLVEKGDPDRGGHSRYGLWLIDNHVEFCIQPNTGSFHLCLDSITPLAENEWHHITAVHTGEALEIYLNGNLDNSSSHGRVGISTTPCEFFLGIDLYAPTPIFTKAVLDDVRIYRRPLTASEVQELHKER